MTPGRGAQVGDAGEDARVIRTRADVARTAFDVLVQEGSDALTHAHVAERAGYSKTTLYKHWPSRFDLAAIALEALGEVQHHQPTGDLRTDLIGELTTFRQAVLDHRLDQVLSAMAQWATDDMMRGTQQDQHRRSAHHPRHPAGRLRRRGTGGGDLDAVRRGCMPVADVRHVAGRRGHRGGGGHGSAQRGQVLTAQFRPQSVKALGCRGD